MMCVCRILIKITYLLTVTNTGHRGYLSQGGFSPVSVHLFVCLLTGITGLLKNY